MKYTKPDIVVRLRTLGFLARSVEAGLRREAAIEIEKLREQVEEWKKLCELQSKAIKLEKDIADGILSNRGSRQGQQEGQATDSEGSTTEASDSDPHADRAEL